MPTYRITYNDGTSPITTQDLPMPRPSDRQPVPGDVIVVAEPFWTPAAITYQPGDELNLLWRTALPCYHRTSSLGNWLVKSKYSVSIWTNIEFMLAMGIGYFKTP
jgi:hypothetical protein